MSGRGAARAPFAAINSPSPACSAGNAATSRPARPMPTRRSPATASGRERGWARRGSAAAIRSAAPASIRRRQTPRPAPPGRGPGAMGSGGRRRALRRDIAPSSLINHKVLLFARFGRFFWRDTYVDPNLSSSPPRSCLPAAAAQADSGRVIGDSIGVGVSWAAGSRSPRPPRTASPSTAARSWSSFARPRKARRCSSAWAPTTPSAARSTSRRKSPPSSPKPTSSASNWSGSGRPACASPGRNTPSKLDGILAAELSGTSATYVSTQGAQFCDAKVHAAEGVHFTMAGYSLMWQKAAAAAGFSTVVADASPARAEAPGRAANTRRSDTSTGRTPSAARSRRRRRPEAAPQ